MWKGLFIIALITAILQIMLIATEFLGTNSISNPWHAVVWTLWAGFCHYKLKKEE